MRIRDESQHYREVQQAKSAAQIGQIDNLERFCAVVSRRLMQGLAEDLGIYPVRDNGSGHYQPEVHNTPRVVVFRLRGARPEHQKKIFTYGKELTQWAGLSANRPVRFSFDRRGITIEIPKPGRYWAKISIDYLDERRLIRPGHCMTVGVDLNGAPVRIDFRRPDVAHLLIAGMSGSGKTVTQQVAVWNIIHNNTPQEAKVVIIDVGKNLLDWRGFDGVPHLVHDLVHDPDEAQALIAYMAREVGRRSLSGQKTPRIYIAIDELKDLFLVSEAVSLNLATIAEKGRAAGIHFIAATQQPQINVFGGSTHASSFKFNMTHTICGRVKKAADGANILGVPESGAEKLQGYGDQLYLGSDVAEPSRFTAAKLTPANMEALDRGQHDRLPLDEAMDVTPDFAPRPGRDPDDFDPEVMAGALFIPGNRGIMVSNSDLRERFKIGAGKAAKYLKWAELARQWAIDNGYRCLPGA